jgi:hypothetical protein
MKQYIIFILMLSLLISNTGEVWGAQVRGVYFSDSASVGDEVLQIRGAGLLKWFIFKVYIAALYVPPDIPSEHVLGDVPKKMVFHYLADMTAEQFAESGEALLLKNASEDELAQIKGKLEEIHDMYRDVKKGERYSLTYIPGKGTELALNNEVLGVIDGYDFAAVYYRIWLGDNPVDDDLKKQLLYNDGMTFSLK